jgi:carbon monoxide dehydrogenase subunit G
MKILKKHDDGDLTVKHEGKTYVVDTDDHVFKLVPKPQRLLKCIHGTGMHKPYHNHIKVHRRKH